MWEGLTETGQMCRSLLAWVRARIDVTACRNVCIIMLLLKFTVLRGPSFLEPTGQNSSSQCSECRPGCPGRGLLWEVTREWLWQCQGSPYDPSSVRSQFRSSMWLNGGACTSLYAQDSMARIEACKESSALLGFSECMKDGHPFMIRPQIHLFGFILTLFSSKITSEWYLGSLLNSLFGFCFGSDIFFPAFSLYSLSFSPPSFLPASFTFFSPSCLPASPPHPFIHI